MRILKAAMLVVFLSGVAVLATNSAALAQTSQQVQDGVNAIGGGNSPSLLTTVGTLVNVFLFLIGLVSVVMIIYAGFRYVTSGGDSSAVASAKNTIIYAIAGLVIAILSFAIINFVIGAFNQSGTNQTIENSNNNDTDGSAATGG